MRNILNITKQEDGITYNVEVETQTFLQWIRGKASSEIIVVREIEGQQYTEFKSFIPFKTKDGAVLEFDHYLVIALNNHKRSF